MSGDLQSQSTVNTQPVVPPAPNVHVQTQAQSQSPAPRSLPQSPEPDVTDVSILADYAPDNPPQALQAALQRVFPKDDARRRAHEKYVMMLIKGKHVLDCLKASGLSWPHVSATMHWHPEYQQIVRAAQNCGKEIRQAQRERALHKRGTTGWKEPVFWKGEVQGYVRKFSDNCLLAALKAEDPAKYREDRPEKGGTGVIVQVNLGIELGQQPPPTVYDTTAKTVEIAPEDATKAQPKTEDTPKTEENQQ